MSSKSTPEIIRKAVQDLERGDHVIFDASPLYELGAYEVGQVVQYVDDYDTQMIAALLTPVVGGEPAMLRKPIGDTITLATTEQVAAAVAERDREQVIRDLHRLIALIRDERLVITPYGGPHISIDLAEGEVSRLAERLGVETKKYGSTQREVSWPVRDSYGQLSVGFHGKPAVDPAAAPETAPAEPGSDAEQAVTKVLGDPWRCSACGHESEHLLNGRCTARLGDNRRCGCTVLPPQRSGE